MINIGRLRTRFTIEQQTYATDAVGGRIPTWTTFRTWWGNLTPVSGRESDFAKSFAATVSHKVIIRFCAGILPTMRLRKGGRIFAINGIIDVEELHREHNLFCTEVLSPAN